MSINRQHWLSRVRQVPSPNWDERPDPTDIALVVVHCISLPAGKFGGSQIDELFCNQLDCTADPTFADLQGVEVSAHTMIDRRGRVTQYVPFDKRAWHAGASSWRGRRQCNNFSVGIELEGTETGTYTKSQYRALGRLLQQLFARYPGLSADAVVGHQQIAPERKRDPGPGFAWRPVLVALAELPE